jgi:hypothetical protein
LSVQLTVHLTGIGKVNVLPEPELVVEGEAVVSGEVVVVTWHLQHAIVAVMPAKGPALFWLT